MRDLIAETSNLKRLVEAAHSLLYRAAGTPGIGLVSGAVGLGKTTAAKHVALTDDAVWLEALPDWTPNWMLGDLAVELGAERCLGAERTRKNFERCVGALRERARAVFIDESDRLVRRMHLVETLRSIHDQTQAPLILIGMRDFPRAVRTVPQLESRVAHWVEFQPCDLKDVRILAEQLCEVALDEPLIKRIHDETAGSARAVRVALERLEKLAKRRRQHRMTLADLPARFEMVYTARNPANAGTANAPESPTLAVVSDARA